MQIFNLFSLGGVVMWPLLGCSLLAVTLILERIIFWIQIIRRQGRVIRDFLYRYQRTFGGDVEIRLIPYLAKNKDLPLVRIFLTALELETPTPEEFRLALESAATTELLILRRFNTVFETIVGIAPLLGLLGTILGLITSFASLRVGDIVASNAGNVSAGISEALVSTASGLVVAIITLLFANIFRGLYQQEKAFIQEYGGQLELIYRRRYDRRDLPDIPENSLTNNKFN